MNGVEESAVLSRFKSENGPEMTVEQYFKNEKKIALRYPHMPCLWVGNAQRSPHVLLPAEFCSVVEGQVVNRKMSEKLTAAMIKHAATSTEVRKRKIMDSIRKARFNEDPCVREFGITVSEEFTRLNARVLNPPSLTYTKSIVKPSQGAWKPAKFLNGVSLKQWTILIIDSMAQFAKIEALAKMVSSQLETGFYVLLHILFDWVLRLIKPISIRFLIFCTF